MPEVLGIQIHPKLHVDDSAAKVCSDLNHLKKHISRTSSQGASHSGVLGRVSLGTVESIDPQKRQKREKQ